MAKGKTSHMLQSCRGNFVRFEHVALRQCERTDRHTYRHRDRSLEVSTSVNEFSELFSVLCQVHAPNVEHQQHFVGMPAEGEAKTEMLRPRGKSVTRPLFHGRTRQFYLYNGRLPWRTLANERERRL